MKILLLGATGFIGRRIAGRLTGAGHQLRLAVRDTASAKRRFPDAEIVACDLARDSISDWSQRLDDVDAVVNAAGLLDSGRSGSLMAVHHDGPMSLFEACRNAGVCRVVHISAISAVADAGTDYADTKRAADQALAETDLDWIILKPSLVYGSGSFGGTSLMRGLAGMPGFIPLPGDGGYRFQPIHVDDLAETALRAVDGRIVARTILEPAGPEVRSLREILVETRRWLDLPPVPTVSIDMRIIRIAGRVLRPFGAGPISPTAVRQMEIGNTGDYNRFSEQSGIDARSMKSAFVAEPSTVQDRWHARLFFMRPVLRLSLILLWLVSGLVGLYFGAEEAGRIAGMLGLPGLAAPIQIGFSLLDIVLAAGLLLPALRRSTLVAQFVLVALYSAGIGWFDPTLWTDLYGPLLKNVPILAAIAISWLMEDDK